MVWSKQSNLVALSSPMKVDFEVYKGDSGSFKITVTNELGAGINISSATWDGDIRADPESATVITNFTFTPTGGDTSSVDIFLSATNSNLLLPASSPYYYDIQMTLAGIVTTLIGGLVHVTQDVSRA